MSYVFGILSGVVMILSGWCPKEDRVQYVLMALVFAVWQVSQILRERKADRL